MVKTEGADGDESGFATMRAPVKGGFSEKRVDRQKKCLVGAKENIVMSRQNQTTVAGRISDPNCSRLLKYLAAAPAFARLRGGLLFTVLLTTANSLPAGNVVTDWNTIASVTVVKNGGKPPSSAPIWFAYTSIAVYDAVNAITGQYQPFYYRGSAPRQASVEAAAVAAAHRVLVNYFPAQQSDLDARFAASMANIIGDPKATEAGISAGEGAAFALIAARTGDGLEANEPYAPGTGNGVWIPTPPAFAPAATPWLKQFRPFTMTTASEFRPEGPTPLTSEPWKRDYNLTRLYGGVNSTLRSAAETEIGLFWTEHPPQQYARAFGYLSDYYRLSVPGSARLMAMIWTGYSDAITACFDAKYTYSFWRPATATIAGGGNSDLQADPSWLPLGATPNHPEYPAAHACATGAVSTLLTGYFGTTKVHFLTDSTVFPDGVHTHVFEDSRDLIDEVFWARIYAGFHYHHSLEVGEKLGTAVANELLRSHFVPRHSGRGSRVESNE